MKLLVITQKINQNDPVLGFFHGWVIEFSKHFEYITTICLEKGECDLPTNVKVLSLGKEKKHSKFQYVNRFYRYIWQERKNYDAVFVHMNQEYVLLGGLIWRLLGKKTYMWRNHHAGTFLTNIAAFFCTKVFCTSKYSFTAKYKKTVIMPVGIDTNLFVAKQGIKRIPRSVLFLGRVSPVKKPDLLTKALIEIKKQNIEFTASFYGDPLPVDQKYYESLKEMVKVAELSDLIKFYKGIPNTKTVEIYNSHDIFVNLSSSGMYDKTIFEAMACECLVLASNDNLHGLIDGQFIFKEGDEEELVEKLKKLLNLDKDVAKEYGSRLRDVVIERHSLRELSNKLANILN